MRRLLIVELAALYLYLVCSLKYGLNCFLFVIDLYGLLIYSY